MKPKRALAAWRAYVLPLSRARRRLQEIRQPERYQRRLDPANANVPTHVEPVGGWLDQEQERLLRQA